MESIRKKIINPQSIVIVGNNITINNDILKNLKYDKNKIEFIKDLNEFNDLNYTEDIGLLIVEYKLDDLSIKLLINKIKNISNKIKFLVLDNFNMPEQAIEIVKNDINDYNIKHINILNNYYNYFPELIDKIKKDKIINDKRKDKDESFDKYRILVDKASEGIIVIQDGIIKFVNPRIIRYSGYSADEIISKPFINFIFHEDEELVINEYKKVSKNENDHTVFTARFIDKNKEIKWVKINVVTIKWEGKNATLNFIDDITDNKKIEEELRYSQEITQALLNATKDFALLMDVDGKLLAINEVAANLLNKDINELIGKSFFKLSPPYLERYRKEIGNKVVRLKKPINYEEVHIERTYYTNIYPIMDKYGDVKRLAIYSHDITEFKKAVEAVKESEEKFKALIENASDGVIIINKDGIIEYSTTTIETVLGYKPEEIYNTSFFDYIHKDNIKTVTDTFKKIFLKPSLKGNIEFKALHKNASWKFIEAIGKNLYNNPIINGIVVTLRDITEKKLAEENLNIYKHIVSSSRDQMAFINKNCEILAANDSFSNAFKYDKNSIIGKNIYEIYGEEEFNNNLKELCHKCFSGIEISFEKWFDFPSLGKRYIIFSLYPYVEKNSKITGIVINTRDITERVQMEMDIVNLQEKEQQRIGIELHDGLSHYLLGIAIKSKILAEKLNKNNIKEEKEAEEIENQLNKAIEETRNLARGLFCIELEDTNIKALLKRIKNDIEARYKINCFIEINKLVNKINKHVISQFFYIIQEAVNNSVKHSKAKNITIILKEENNHLFLIIKDDGIGISENFNNKSGMGINIMRYRARIIGASFDILRGNNIGTEVRCKLKKT